MDVESYSLHYARTWHQPQTDEQAQGHKQDARVKEKPAWTMQKHQSQMSPPISPRSQMRWTPSTGMKMNSWNLGDSQAEGSRFENHLAGELHAGGTQSHL